MSSYFQLLNALLALGPMIPQALVILERMANDAKALYELTGQIFPQSIEAPPTEDEIAAESRLIEAMASPGTQAIFDSSRLRKIAKLLKDSGALDIAIQLLLAKLGGAATGGLLGS